MPFHAFGLSDPLVQGILATGYTAPTEIQSKAIPAAVAGQDIIGCAQTGTGKTAAFVLPILDRLCHESVQPGSAVRALILAPTRELAIQIEAAIKDYGRFTKLKALAVFGGVNINPQIKALEKGVDLVVATPGRLLDLLERGCIDLAQVEVLVLDEADRMLDMGFVHDVKRVVRHLPKQRQTLLFSATLSPEVKQLSGSLMKSPKKIQIGRLHNPIDSVTQHFYRVDKPLKLSLLLHLIEEWRMFSVLVFSRTKHGADRICRQLKRAGIVAVPIHSGRTQNQRQRALESFRSGKTQVMVATDIAARGIDVEGISHVINFDVPSHAEDYVHRIGRTGRAAATGDAVTFVSDEEDKALRDIGKFIERKLKAQKCDSFSYVKVILPASKPKPAKKSKPSKNAKSSSKVKSSSATQKKKTAKKNRPSRRQRKASKKV